MNCLLLFLLIGEKMAFNRYISLGTTKAEGIVPGEIFARKVSPGKYILFRLTYENKPRVVGLTTPSTKSELVKYGYLSKQDARKL